MADFSEMFSKYAQARLDQATQPFNDPEAYFNNRMQNQFGVGPEGNVKPKSTTVNYNDDGSQEITHKFNVPSQAPAYSAPNYEVPQAVAPAAQMQPVAAPAEMAGGQMQNALYRPPAQEQTWNDYANPELLKQPTAPQVEPVPPQVQVPTTQEQVQPETQPQAQLVGYNQKIAQQESGGNANIGYHYPANAQGQRQSTAYGPYGITAAAWQDARRANPGLPEDISQATPEQMNQGMNQVTTNNARALQAYGVQPSEATLAGAHFLGAKGLADYLKNGTISPAAAAANGGEENVRRIVDARLMGQPAPSSGAVTNPQLQLTNSINENKNNPAALHQIAFDASTDPGIAKLAQDQLVDHYTGVKETQQATKTIEQAVGGDPKAQTQMMRDLRKETSEGSYVKAILFARLGLTQLADEEQQKLGAKSSTSIATLGGENYAVKIDGNGNITKAYNSAGDAVDDKTIAKLQAGGLPVKGVQQHAQIYGDPTGALKGNYVLETRPGQTPLFKEVSTGALLSGTDAAKLKALGVAGTFEQQYQGGYAKSGGGKQGSQAAEGYVQGALPNAPGMGGGASAPAAGAPAVSGAQPANAAPAMGAPAMGAQPANATPATAPAPLPANAPVWQQKQQAMLGGKTQEAQIERGAKRNEAFDKIIDTEYRDNAAKGEAVVNSRKNQFNILDRLDENGKPVAEQITGLYNAANENPGEQKYSIIRDIFGGTFKPETEVSQRLAQLNLTPKAKAALLEYNAENAKIAAQTLRETSGPGSVSDAEQAANRARNVDITKTPMIGAYQMMAQSQFNGDLQRYKADMAADSKLPNATTFDKQFRKESATLTDTYRKIAEDRLKFIQDGGNSPNAIREGYKRYPAPQYDPNSGTWKYTKSLGQIFGK